LQTKLSVDPDDFWKKFSVANRANTVNEFSISGMESDSYVHARSASFGVQNL
jgi:hypothetical protein